MNRPLATGSPPIDTPLLNGTSIDDQSERTAGQVDHLVISSIFDGKWI
jgi:hypothetical protein